MKRIFDSGIGRHKVERLILRRMSICLAVVHWWGVNRLLNELRLVRRIRLAIAIVLPLIRINQSLLFLGLRNIGNIIIISFFLLELYLPLPVAVTVSISLISLRFNLNLLLLVHINYRFKFIRNLRLLQPGIVSCLPSIVENHHLCLLKSLSPSLLLIIIFPK
jgi:hypothetical protein